MRTFEDSTFSKTRYGTRTRDPLIQDNRVFSDRATFLPLPKRWYHLVSTWSSVRFRSISLSSSRWFFSSILFSAHGGTERRVCYSKDFLLARPCVPHLSMRIIYILQEDDFIFHVLKASPLCWCLARTISLSPISSKWMSMWPLVTMYYIALEMHSFETCISPCSQDAVFWSKFCSTYSFRDVTHFFSRGSYFRCLVTATISS